MQGRVWGGNNITRERGTRSGPNAQEVYLRVRRGPAYLGGCSSPFNQPIHHFGFQRIGAVAFKALERALSLATGRQR